MYGRLFRRHLKRSRRRFVRYALLSANIALLAGVVVFISRHPNDPTRSTNALLGQDQATVAPLDQLSAADIAVHVSRLTGMAEAVAITNQADSESTELAITPADDIVVAKPQLASTSSKSAKDIKTYVTVAGDTLESLAAKFGVTSDSIRWSNGLTSNTLSAGRGLVIPPVTGIVYTVKAGDTVDSLTTRFSGNKDALIADNDAEVGGIKVGQRILIRGGIIPVGRATTSTYAARSFSFGSSAIYGYNGYDYGYCTWYVANVRTSVGRALPANLGNASTWDDRAIRAGLSVNKSPAYGAAVVTSQRGAGHVAFVERVNEDGSVWISEMNSRGQVSMTDGSPAGGWGRRDFKLIPADQARTYNYIH